MDIPRHVAIILDGNGRWAKKKGMPRTYGHTVGAKNVETILKAADEIGIKYVTMYAFSTENWGRPSDEVKTLMNILDSYLKTMGETARKNNTRMRCIGDISRLDEKLQRSIRNLEEETKGYTGLNFQIALNYGSR
ncbi:MAG: di-trans,poly-cis-decaprenylcistransferase, partial [Lachnospiraceae bacterium]|nr:di-trans,poly-cis-decaprenylcistransferase [Lachnospiraceae bacterium]